MTIFICTSQHITIGSTSKNEATPLKEKNIEKVTEPRSFTLRVLEEITNDFSKERAINQGAYAKVYLVRFIQGMHAAQLFFSY